MRNTSGAETESYPVTAYDINSNAMGTAADKGAYLSLWNSDSDNKIIGTLYGAGGPFGFLLVVNNGQTPPAWVLGNYGGTAPNIAPTSNAGIDQTITLPTSTATLSGSGTDLDGTIASYLWTKLSGPSGGAITSASSASTGLTGLTAGTYVYRLRVTDNLGAIGDDTVTITVNPALFAFSVHPASQTVAEGETVSFTASVANGSPNYTARWYKNSALVLTETALSSTSFSATFTPANGDIFYLTVTDSLGNLITSNNAAITVTTAPITFTRGYSATDPFVDSSTAPTISNPVTTTITSGANLTFTLPAAAADKYWVVKELASQPVKISWYHNTDNSGPIPGDVVRRWTVGLYRYYASVSEFVLTYTDSIQLNQ